MAGVAAEETLAVSRFSSPAALIDSLIVGNYGSSFR